MTFWVIFVCILIRRFFGAERKVRFQTRAKINLQIGNEYIRINLEAF